MSVGVETSGLRKRLKANEALSGVTLSFEPGVLNGVIGPDGAGKTTLLRVLIGLLAPTEGTVAYSVDGRPAGFDAIRPGMAYMPQQPSLYPDLSVREHLEFFADLYRLPPEMFRQRSEELLRITRLERFQDRRAGRLSGGMYKKLGLMCALLQSPSLMLLDEPTNGVDPISRREFWELLGRVTARKVTVIISTAYMEEADRCARVHLLEAGKVLASGAPAELKRERGIKGFAELFLRLGGAA